MRYKRGGVAAAGTGRHWQIGTAGAEGGIGGRPARVPAHGFRCGRRLDTRASAARLEWLAGYRPAAFFMAGGAGEFFSLTADEYAALLAGTVSQRSGGIPILGAAGYGTHMAVAFARETEAPIHITRKAS
jgi:hypothetical protein